MPRLNAVRPEDAAGPTRAIFDGLQKKMGRVINAFRGMGNSPAALNAYLRMSEALGEGDLSVEDREAIYLAVSQRNGCDYCVAAHVAIAKRAGMAESEIDSIRALSPDDAKLHTLVYFVGRVMDTNGYVIDEELDAVRAAGYTDGQIVEALAYIGLATYSNLFNHVNDTAIDFPVPSAV